MAPLPDVAKVVKCALVFSDGINTDVVTRFYLQYTGTEGDPADLDAYATLIHSTFIDNVAAEMHEDLSLIRVELTDLTTVTAPIGLDTSSDPGTATGDPVPLSAAVVSSYVISRRYRGGHPRGYWPLGAGAVLTNPQRWDSGFIASCQTNIDAFFTGVFASPWSGAGSVSHVNVSYFEGFTVVTDPITGRARNVPTLRGTPVVDAVVATVARLRVGTQRRRLQYK
jgi:hypothetical protein